MGLLRPDVYVEETLATNIPPSGPISPAGAFIGQSWKGPIVPTRVTSWQRYVQLFGGFPKADEGTFSYLHYAVNQFFANSGGECWVCRVVDTSPESTAAASAVSLVDHAGSPVDTLEVAAANPGTWGDKLYVGIVDRDAAAGRFDLSVYYGGTSDSYIVERWADLSMDPDDARYVESVINPSGRGSIYITVTDLLSATAAPNNRPTGVAGPFQLASGDNGADPADVDFTTTIQKFDAVLQPLVLAIPGQTSDTVTSAALQYAEGRRDIFVVIDPPAGTDVSTVTGTFQPSLTSTSFGALYYPWLYFNDAASVRSGVTRLLPPSGGVVGQVIATDRAVGPHKTPAGITTRVAGAVGLERTLTLEDFDNLNRAHVNAFRPGPNGGVIIMGGRTLVKTGADRYISVRRSVIYLRDALTRLTEFAVFQPNDPGLWSQITQRLTEFLLKFYAQGGLRGKTAAEAFYVKCDSETNPQSIIDSGEVHVEVGVAIQYPTEFVVIKLGQWEGGSSAQEVI